MDFYRWLYLALTTPDDIGQRPRQAGQPLGWPRVKGEAAITRGMELEAAI